jgi:hypothetical protein
MNHQSQKKFPQFFSSTTNDELEAQGVNLGNFHYLMEEMMGDLQTQKHLPTEERFSAVFWAVVRHDLHVKSEIVADMLSQPAILNAIQLDNGDLFSRLNTSAQMIAVELIDSYAKGFQIAALKLIMDPAEARAKMIDLGSRIFDSVFLGLTRGTLFSMHTTPLSQAGFIPGTIQLITMSQICHPEFSERFLQSIRDEMTAYKESGLGGAKPATLDFLESIHMLSGRVDSLGCPAFENLPGGEKNIPVVINKIFLALADEPNHLRVFEGAIWCLAMNASFSYLQAGVPAHKVISFVRQVANATVPILKAGMNEQIFDSKDYADVMIASAFSAHPEYWPAIKKEALLGINIDLANDFYPESHSFGPFMLLNRHQKASEQFHARLVNAGCDPLSIVHAPRQSLHTAYLAAHYFANPDAAVARIDQMFTHTSAPKQIPSFLFHNAAIYPQLQDQTKIKLVEQCVQDLNDPLSSHHQRQAFLAQVLAKEQSLLQTLMDYVSSNLESDAQLGAIIAAIPEVRLKRLSVSDRVMSNRLETDLGL